MAVRNWKRWVVVGVAAATIAVVAGPFVYIHFVEGSAPAPLALSSASPSTGSAKDPPGGTDGAWKVAGGSVVGYRVKETLFGQSNVAVGRTSHVTGSITVAGTSIAGARFTVDMTTVTSDESRRDDQFHGRIMDTATYPAATFTLTGPIDFGAIPGQNTEKTFRVTGDLTMHGVTKSVTFEATGRYYGLAAPGGGVDSHHLRRLEHRESKLRPGLDRRQRRARVRPELRPRLTRGTCAPAEASPRVAFP